jgi:hypothetical protein
VESVEWTEKVHEMFGHMLDPLFGDVGRTVATLADENVEYGAHSNYEG